MNALSLPGIDHYLVPALPGLVAGEYPGHQEEPRAIERIRLLYRAGVTWFVDLTEEGELAPYAPLLATVAGVGPVAGYRRFPIRDARVPHHRSVMAAILDELDQARAEGHLVYLHCWGGVGRTGTVVGCGLVRHGLTGAAALDEVGRLFAETAKGRSGWVAPETEAQAAFVRNWAESAA